MFSHRNFKPLATSIATFLIAATASAAELTWDADGGAGVSVGGTGVWDTAGLNWTDGATLQPWTNPANNIAIFGGDTAGTVTLSAPIAVGGLVFDTEGYVITGQTLLLGVAGDNTIAVNASATINSILAGDSAATLKITGTSTLTLGGLNTYAGPTSIVGTSVEFNNFGDASGGNLGTTGQISVAGGKLRYTGGSVSTERNLVFSGGTFEIVEASTTVTTTGVVTHTGAQTLTKAGAGTLSLEGVADNVGSRVVLNEGKIVLAKTSSSAVHAMGSGGGTDYALVINGGVAQLGGTGDEQLYYRSSVLMNGGTFDMNGRNEGFDQLFGTAAIVTNSAAGTVSTLTLGENQGSSTFEGVFQDGLGTLALTKTGTGTLTLTGVNLYSGGTIINGGTLLATSLASLPGYLTPGKVIVNSGGTIAVRIGDSGQWQGADLQALRASATFNPGAGIGIDTTNGDYTYGEVLSGDFSFSKLGGNTLLLTGANSHTAGTKVAGGTLKLGHATAFGTGPGTVDGGTLDLNGFSITTPMLSGTGGEVTNSSTTDTTITINLGANTAGKYDGTLSTLSTGKLHLVINTTAGGTASNYSLNSFNSFVGSITVNGVGNNLGTRGILGIAASGGLGDPNNVLTLNNGGTLSNLYNPATTGSWPNFSSAVIDNPIVLTGAAGGVVRAGYTGVLTLNGVISGPGGLTKTDGSIVALTADNTYAGPTTIAAGTLRLGDGGTTGSLPATSLLTFGTGTGTALVFNREGHTIFPNNIVKGGRANVTVSENQTVTLTGSISGTTEFWVSGPGTLVVSPNSNTTGAGSIVVNKGATLSISDFSTNTIGSGNIFLGQGGTEATLRYTGSSASTGRLVGGVFQGTAMKLEVAEPTTTLTLTSNIGNTAAGTGRTFKTGPGRLAMTGANTYIGGTTVAEGTLLVNNTAGSGTGTGSLELLANAILGGTGTIAPSGANGLALHGTIAPGDGIGTLTVNLDATEGTMSLTDTALFKFELGAAGSIDVPGVSDRLVISGAISGDVAFNNNLIDFGASGQEGWYRLFSTSFDSTTWAGLTVNDSNIITGGLGVVNLGNGLTGELVIGDGIVGSNGHIYLHVVPEPGSTSLLLGAAGFLVGTRRRRFSNRC